MFPESRGFVAVPFTRLNNFVSLHWLDWNKLEHVSLIQLVTGIATKPWLSRNMLPNIKTWENELSNFSENLRIVALNCSSSLDTYHQIYHVTVIYFNFVLCLGPLLSKEIFSAQSIHREVYGITYILCDMNLLFAGYKLIILWIVTIYCFSTWEDGSPKPQLGLWDFFPSYKLCFLPYSFFCMPSSVSLSCFILAILIRKCLGKGEFHIPYNHT